MAKDTNTAVFSSLLALTVIGQPVPVDAQPGAAARTEAREQAREQATRQITQSISRRATQAVLSAAERKKPEGLAGAWASSSYSNITFSSIDTEVYQVVGGADKRLGRFYAGASVGYTGQDVDVNGPDLMVGDELISGAERDFFSVHNPSFSPYAAYIINDHVFLTGTAGYARLESDPEPAEDEAFTDLSVTGLLPLNEWIVVGQFGHRFSYSVTTERTSCEITRDVARNELREAGIPVSLVSSDCDSDLIVNTLYLTGEVGYRIDRWLPYFHASYQHLLPGEAGGVANVFVGLGATYDFSDMFSAGVAYNTDLQDLEDGNYHQAVVDIRFRF